MRQGSGGRLEGANGEVGGDGDLYNTFKIKIKKKQINKLARFSVDTEM